MPAIRSWACRFQSTLLMRGATQDQTFGPNIPDISIHAPHARSDSFFVRKRRQAGISIHAPHARSDDVGMGYMRSMTIFQSTLLMRGATCRAGNWGEYLRNFNPRSSCEERLIGYLGRTAIENFNPRSSCEERRIWHHNRGDHAIFQSTLLMRGATEKLRRMYRRAGFQSTLLMRGATLQAVKSYAKAKFQSTLLMRGATVAQADHIADVVISIHAPHARSDCFKFVPKPSTLRISIHAPHARSDCYKD